MWYSNRKYVESYLLKKRDGEAYEKECKEKKFKSVSGRIIRWSSDTFIYVKAVLGAERSFLGNLR